MKTSAPKIVTLLPSATEIVCALGFRENLVGRSHECDYPPEVAELPVLTKPQIPTEGSSAAVDRAVKTLIERGLSIYWVDAEKIKALAPDVVVTQTQCEVCAVSLGELEKALGDWVEGRPLLISLRAVSLSGLWDDIRKVGGALGASDAAEGLVRDLKSRMARIQAKAKIKSERPRVAMIEWLDPLMAAGNWMPEMIEMAGGISIFGDAGEHSPWLPWEDFAASKPDIILIFPCGFSISRARREKELLTRHPEWEKIPAVQNNRVFWLDGNQYFNRPGPRLAESLEILAEILHPDIFSFGHKDTGWELFQEPNERLLR